MAVEEGAEPRRGAKLQGPMAACLRFEPPASEVIRAGRYDYTGSNLEGSKQGFAMRVPVELETVSRFQTHVDGCHEVGPGLDDSFRVGITYVTIFQELLSYPAKPAVFRGPRLVVHTDSCEASAGARQEP